MQVWDFDNNVVEASKKRIEYVFDHFDNYVISISGGKDSTVLFHLVMQEAIKRGVKVNVFFLDEEVITNSTYEMIKYLMNLYPENTIKHWYQIPFALTNAVSVTESQLICWEPKKHKIWMRTREKDSVQHTPWKNPKIKNKNKGFGFYDVLENFTDSFENTAFFIGLRALESLNRWRTMVKSPGYDKCMWSTKKGKNVNFYPIYDWHFQDVWKYIGEENLKYSKLYDFQFLKGISFSEMRTSSLIHEKSFKSIVELPEYEPKTYEKLLKRVRGISFAQDTAKKNKGGFSVTKLPKNFKKWVDFRNHLLETHADLKAKEIFTKRFSNHLNNEYVARQQCRQLIVNDYENNLPVDNKEDPKVALINKWKEIL